MGADLRRVAVVPCGVDLELFRPDGPAAPRPSVGFRLLVVSRLVERKGIGNVITAMASFPRPSWSWPAGRRPGSWPGTRRRGG